MSSQPLVSAVIIVYNGERFLVEAIRSVFAQSYTEWELLLVDDGSTDRSSDIARDWAARYPERVRYLEHSGHVNRGMSASRNLGIQQAHGVYVALLDADDVWVEHTLEEQVALLEAHPDAAMVYGPLRWWHSWTGAPEDRDRDYVERLGVPENTLIQPPRLLSRFLRDKAAVPSGLLVRRESIARLGGFEDEFRGEYEDQVFCSKICLNAPVFAAGRSWYWYRQHPDSCVTIGLQTGATTAARLRFLEWVAAYLDQHPRPAPSVRRALRLEFWQFRRPRAFRLLRRADRLVGNILRFLEG